MIIMLKLSLYNVFTGAAPEPCIRTLDETWLWSLLQCQAHGVPRPTLKWEDSDNNTLHAEEPQNSERGGRFYITSKTTVTKTANYRCVATQEEISHQVAAVTYVSFEGESLPSCDFNIRIKYHYM